VLATIEESNVGDWVGPFQKKEKEEKMELEKR